MIQKKNLSLHSFLKFVKLKFYLNFQQNNIFHQANPEKYWIENNYEYHQSEGLSLHELTRTFKEENSDKIEQVDMKSMKQTVEELDYEVRARQVKGIVKKLKVEPILPKGQGRIDKVSK